MTTILLNVFMGFNVLVGFFFLLMGLWPTAEEKPAAIIIVFVLWGAAFIGLASVIFLRLKMARPWTFILYGLLTAVVVVSLLGQFSDPNSMIAKAPLAYGVFYLLWLAVSIGPIVLMLRQDVKEYFSGEEEEVQFKKIDPTKQQ